MINIHFWGRQFYELSRLGYRLSAIGFRQEAFVIASSEWWWRMINAEGKGKIY